MGHDTALIAMIAAGLGLAFVFGLLAHRLKLPLLLGYLGAGMAVGPFTPGFVADQGIASQLAEIGVSLLMFGVGLHFSIGDLVAVRRIAIPGAIAQIVVATAIGALLGRSWGWTWSGGIVFGLSLSVASTVVLLRSLGERRLLETPNGGIAVGWLIVEDIVTVLALVALPAMAGSSASSGSADGGSFDVVISISGTLVKVAVFVAAMLVFGKQVIPRLLSGVARTGHKELFTLGVIALALGIGFGAAVLFGVSPALGAFFAGVVISESDLSHRAGAETQPLQQVFAVLFFVSVGMLFDPSVLIEHPWRVLATLLTIVVGKSLAAAAIVLLLRRPLSTALTISASLAQIGEFSFVLVALGVQLKMVPTEALSIVVAAAILSIAGNPLVFNGVVPLERWIGKRWKRLSLLAGDALDDDKPSVPEVRDHAIVVGFGRVGATVGEALERNDIPYVAVELERSVVDDLRAQGKPCFWGDASRPGLLQLAGAARARLLVIASPEPDHAMQMVDLARELNPDLPMCVRTHTFADADRFREKGISSIVMGEHELALQMAQYAMEAMGLPMDAVAQTDQALRTKR